jgi:carbonic anhydrase
MLKEGNLRYVEGRPLERSFDADARRALAEYGQNPFATIIGCADSRCPLEILFDVQPGDIFVLRNAGNTCTHAEGSMVGSVEYSVGHLHTNLVLVLGHTRCGAIAGATSTALSAKSNSRSDDAPSSTLDKLLRGLGPVALQAAAELPADATVDEVAAHAVKVNVFHTIEKLLTYSKPLREKVTQGDVAVQGAIYDIVSGKVAFLGTCPRQALVLDMDTGLVPRVEADSSPNGKNANCGGA